MATRLTNVARFAKNGAILDMILAVTAESVKPFCIDQDFFKLIHVIGGTILQESVESKVRPPKTTKIIEEMATLPLGDRST